LVAAVESVQAARTIGSELAKLPTPTQVKKSRRCIGTSKNGFGTINYSIPAIRGFGFTTEPIG
jgi:hypothetical protein